MRRRGAGIAAFWVEAAAFLVGGAAFLNLGVTVPAAASAAATYAAVTGSQRLEFPRDFGSHPQFRTEWWYVTGWLSTHDGGPLGFQITFFRTKPPIDDANPSAFSPRQILIAHCALSDPKRGRLWQDQRVRRAGLGLAEARGGDTAVWIDRWSLTRNAAGVYVAKIDADDFSFALTLSDTQTPLLNGNSGVSRKGPDADAASYYYSLPHMRTAGKISRKGKTDEVTGEAWFDHEWTSEYLDSRSVGWDWIGINLADGAALMAFRIRDAAGDARYAGATLRSADGRVRTFEPDQVTFTPNRLWRSARTGIAYPVQWRVRVGNETLDLDPLLDDQENDTRLSTGAIYWEGAVRALEDGRPVGRGYLELTGYGKRLELR